MISGQRPKATALKLLENNPGKRRLNDQEPQPIPVAGLPDPPRKLKGEAKREWSRVIPFIMANSLTGQEGLSVLATYCGLHAAVVQAERRGEVPSASLIAQYRMMAETFGFTPSARTRIKSGNAKKDTDEERYFG